MTAMQVLTLFSAIFGGAGSMVLAAGTYGLAPNAAYGFADPERQQRINAANKQRKITQRIGLGLILVAFILQGISAFAPG